MRRNPLILLGLMLLAATALIFTRWTSAQSSNAERRITQAVDEAKLIRLQGNTHPLARPEFDQGAAPPDLPAEHMFLLLKRSPEQEAALSKLMTNQQDPSSPNFHKWLSPDEFGQRFGASEADIQTVTSWLESHGFQINEVTRGRTLIDFSGTASNVKEALHTEIHKYFVNGEEHWANAYDPQIPAALTPVVVGINTLHNFRRKPMNRSVGTFQRTKATGEVRPLNPQFNFGSPCGLQNGTCFLVAPTDFATIYNVLPLWTAGIDGTGETIAIVGDSNINPADAHNFRSVFGLPVNDPQVIVATGASDPGVKPCPGGDECEADIDTQWSGAVAKGATIKLVIAADTNVSLGPDTAAKFIVNNMAPTPQVLSESFGNCELAFGTMENAFFNSLWQQAAAEKITVVVSTGDNGSAGCESATSFPAPATRGLAVNGIASTPFNTAVGGTDFDQFNNTGAFWNPTNTAMTQVSAKGYIPETTWNDSCTNHIFGLVGFSTSAQTNCNSTAANFQSAIVPVGGSGGISNCTTPSGVTPSSCSGGYAKPAWQTAMTPADGKRDLPDVSLFAGAGLLGSFYPVCDQDLNTPVTNPVTPCNVNPGDFGDIQGFGGTSVSVQAFAGIVAMIDQKKGGLGQGLINPRLYTLAGMGGNTCASTANPATTCIFYDVTKGTIAQPCKNGSTNCSETVTSMTTPLFRNTPTVTIAFVALACLSFAGLLILGFRLKERNWSVAFALLVFALFMTCAACGSGGGNGVGNGGGGGGAANGILTGFDATAGYDRATGLGSVNVTNLVNNF